MQTEIVADSVSPVSSARTSVIHALMSGSSSCITLLGDETGNDPTEWLRLMARKLGSRYPEFRIIYQYYDDPNNRFGPEEIVRYGSAGERYLNLTGTIPRYQSISVIPAVTGDSDIRVKVQHNTWLPTNPFSIHAHWGAAGNRGRNLWVRSSGVLVFAFSTDGTNQINVDSTASIPVPTRPDTTAIWLRATRVSASGLVQFFTGVETISSGFTNITWTKLGNDVTSTTGNTFASTADYSIGGRGLSGGPYSELLTGKIYSIIDRNGIDGPIVNPQPIDSWYSLNTTTDTNTFEGSPTLYIRNGSLAGASLSTYFDNAIKRPLLVAPFEPGVLLLSTGVNEGTVVGRAYEARLDAWLANVRARAPMLQPIVINQHPFIAPRTELRIAPQRYRATQLPFWASRVGIPCIDTYHAFMRSGRPLSELVNGTATGGNGSDLRTDGSSLWADVVLRALTSN